MVRAGCVRLPAEITAQVVLPSEEVIVCRTVTEVSRIWECEECSSI